MINSASGAAQDRVLVVGLLADPGLPLEITERLAGQLETVLARRSSARVCWRVQIRNEPLMLDERGDIPILELARQWQPREGWELLVCVTDLPRRGRLQPIIAEFSVSPGAALISLPAIGWFRLRRHLLDTLVTVLGDMSDEHTTKSGGSHPLHHPTGWLSPVRREDSPQQELEASLVLRGLRGRTRLLFGMVRDNRPWRLVPSLSSALAAAAGTAAFGVFYSSIWGMADALSPARLTLINVFAIGVMVTWFILYNGLWESPRARLARQQAALYNASTVLTLALGVVSMYVVLFGVTLLASLAVIATDYLRAQLGHPVGLADYGNLAWLASSMGTVAGALGSSLESEDAVPQATYSERERQRRSQRHEQDEQNRFDR